jgi:hypothetical protein
MIALGVADHCYMSKEETKDLVKFLKPFPDEIKERALWLRGFIWDQYPGRNELIYDNYTAVALGWSLTDKVNHTFCFIAVGRSSHNVHFGYYWGSQIADAKKILQGSSAFAIPAMSVKWSNRTMPFRQAQGPERTEGQRAATRCPIKVEG